MRNIAGQRANDWLGSNTQRDSMKEFPTEQIALKSNVSLLGILAKWTSLVCQRFNQFSQQTGDETMCKYWTCNASSDEDLVSAKVVFVVQRGWRWKDVCFSFRYSVIKTKGMSNWDEIVFSSWKMSVFRLVSVLGVDWYVRDFRSSVLLDNEEDVPFSSLSLSHSPSSLNVCSMIYEAKGPIERTKVTSSPPCALPSELMRVMLVVYSALRWFVILDESCTSVLDINNSSSSSQRSRRRNHQSPSTMLFISFITRHRADKCLWPWQTSISHCMRACALLTRKTRVQWTERDDNSI